MANWGHTSYPLDFLLACAAICLLSSGFPAWIVGCACGFFYGVLWGSIVASILGVASSLLSLKIGKFIGNFGKLQQKFRLDIIKQDNFFGLFWFLCALKINPLAPYNLALSWLGLKKAVSFSAVLASYALVGIPMNIIYSWAGSKLSTLESAENPLGSIWAPLLFVSILLWHMARKPGR